jgi:hypothetical protein
MFVLTVIAMALLAGRREIAEMARFATSLSQLQRRRLGFPLKKGTKAFWQVPSYRVFYQVLTRMDPEAFANILNDWLQSRAGSLPGALALDGKMIRDHIGLLTLTQHEDGAPVAVAVYDQKEGTERCELSAAWALLQQSPALDGKMITADANGKQRKTENTETARGASLEAPLFYSVSTCSNVRICVNARGLTLREGTRPTECVQAGRRVGHAADSFGKFT